VKDATATVAFLSSIWDGIVVEKDETYEPLGSDLVVRPPFKVRLVEFTLGPLRIELLQPLDDHSVWAKFIAEKGEGIHHVAFDVSNYDDLSSTFQTQGRPMLASAGHKGERWCYFDTPGGAIFELRED
jgi:methylmalonyl-CoA/ethylmalonyl-CoA epimerase